jgi:hypothetical protein
MNLVELHPSLKLKNVENDVRARIVQSLIILGSTVFILSGCITGQEHVAFLTNRQVIIESLPDHVTDVETFIVGSDEKTGILSLAKGSACPTWDGNICIFCAKKIKIAPNLIIPISGSESIVSGKNGATLLRKKGGKGVILINGEAYLLKKK